MLKTYLICIEVQRCWQQLGGIVTGSSARLARLRKSGLVYTSNLTGGTKCFVENYPMRIIPVIVLNYMIKLGLGN